MAKIDPEDFEAHDMCPDCRGRGRLVTFQWDDPCKLCEGAGWVSKGEGINKTQWLALTKVD